LDFADFVFAGEAFAGFDFAPDFAANEFVQASATAKAMTIKRSIVILRTKSTFTIQKVLRAT
jgi:hypothetical protein